MSKPPRPWIDCGLRAVVTSLIAATSIALAIQTWDCKGLWIFESFQLMPARSITAQIQTTSDVNLVLPMSVQVGAVPGQVLQLTGTSVLRPPYDFKLESADRSVVIDGTLKVTAEPSPLELSVLLEGYSLNGARVTGVLKCVPK